MWRNGSLWSVLGSLAEMNQSKLVLPPHCSAPNDQFPVSWVRIDRPRHTNSSFCPGTLGTVSLLGNPFVASSSATKSSPPMQCLLKRNLLWLRERQLDLVFLFALRTSTTTALLLLLLSVHTSETGSPQSCVLFRTEMQERSERYIPQRKPQQKIYLIELFELKS